MNANSTVQSLVTSLGMHLIDTFQKGYSTDTNLMFSPLSIFSALFMFMYASLDTSPAAQELVQSFGLEKPRDKKNIHVYTLFFKNFFYDLIDKYDEVPTSSNQIKANLILANSLWGTNMKKGFRNLARRELLCDTFDEVPTPTGIETWLRNATKGNIDDIVSRDMVFKENDLFLTSTLYFTGAWETPFDPAKNTVQTFNIPGNQFISATMMNQVKQSHPYYENSKYQLLDLTYTDDRFTASLVLPREILTFQEFYRLMTPSDWTNILKENRRNYLVNVTIPKFDIESHINLGPYLEKINVTSIFKPNTVFPYLSAKPKNLVQYIHKTHVEVAEFGSKTVVPPRFSFLSYFTNPFLRYRVRSFHCDRPFLFVLKTKISGVPLFVTYITNPATI
ncbi:hypothetical protein K7432_015475 [Basidiobolus ranarum]|uniref:Serpin domain-containing protein n=1 Tax=Basidiobolus ranarum TaxID=34480 RepID=A0ABR2VN06_9FUNG